MFFGNLRVFGCLSEFSFGFFAPRCPVTPMDKKTLLYIYGTSPRHRGDFHIPGTAFYHNPVQASAFPQNFLFFLAVMASGDGSGGFFFYEKAMPSHALIYFCFYYSPISRLGLFRKFFQKRFIGFADTGKYPR
jgi:hypothetical protein